MQHATFVAIGTVGIESGIHCVCGGGGGDGGGMQATQYFSMI